jgi:hypothetical protein
MFSGVTAATVLGLASFLRTISYVNKIPAQLDFSQFYLAALVARVSPGTSFYDPRVLDRFAAGLGLSEYMTPNYPPVIALLFRPLTWLTYEAAKTVWFTLNVLVMGGLLVWARRRLPPSRKRAVWFLAWFLVLSPATMESLILGQMNAILGVLLLIAAQSAQRTQRKWDVVSGVSLGLAGAIKLWPLLVGGYFLIRRRSAIVVVSVIVFLALTAASGFVLGGEIVQDYFTDRLPGSGRQYAQSFTAPNQSIWGVAQRLYRGGTTRYTRLSNNNSWATEIRPLVRSDLLYWLTTVGFCASMAVFLTVLLVNVRAGDGAREAEAYWALVVALLTVLPFSWTHYAFLMVFPLVSLLCDEKENTSQTVVIGAVCLLCLLVQRFFAWLPPSPLLLNFVFVAEMTMVFGLAASVTRSAAGNGHAI